MLLGTSLAAIRLPRPFFSPASLFAAGEQGLWYDPSDFSTMFQDDAGTTPVTATGQAVGRILDKSGRGNHATQSNGSFKPALQQDGGGRYYLSFDGLDDFWITSTVNLSAGDAVTIFCGTLKPTSTANLLVEFGSTVGAAGSFAMRGAGTNLFSNGSVLATLNGPAYTINSKVVATGRCDVSDPMLVLRKNGANAASNSDTQGTGNYGNKQIYIGRRGGSSLPYDGRLYSLIVRAATTDANTIAKTEAWVNEKTGAF